MIRLSKHRKSKKSEGENGAEEISAEKEGLESTSSKNAQVCTHFGLRIWA